MAHNYPELAFGEAAKKLQEQFGSRSTYARMEKQTIYDGLTDAEEGFIAERDSFYMASVGENGFPYVQHRGGPKGFVKIIGPLTLAFADFRGNKQYITMGNAATNNKVALIFMDYPHRARLKIYAKLQVVGLAEDVALAGLLALQGYTAKEERYVKLTVEAFDWNCQQHITPRYTTADIEAAFAPQRAYMEQLKAENQRLREALQLNPKGYGPASVV